MLLIQHSTLLQQFRLLNCPPTSKVYLGSCRRASPQPPSTVRLGHPAATTFTQLGYLFPSISLESPWRWHSSLQLCLLISYMVPMPCLFALHIIAIDILDRLWRGRPSFATLDVSFSLIEGILDNCSLRVHSWYWVMVFTTMRGIVNGADKAESNRFKLTSSGWQRIQGYIILHCPHVRRSCLSR